MRSKDCLSGVLDYSQPSQESLVFQNLACLCIPSVLSHELGTASGKCGLKHKLGDGWSAALRVLGKLHSLQLGAMRYILMSIKPHKHCFSLNNKEEKAYI